MAKSISEIITEIKGLVGRSRSVGTDIDLDTILLNAINYVQDLIVKKCPCILELQVKDTTTLDTVEDQYEYSIASLDIAHLQDVWILDGTSTHKLTFIDLELFDDRFPDVDSESVGLPDYYTRRGSNIEFNCPIDSEYASKDIRLNYCKKPAAFTSSISDATCDINDIDTGLILYGWYKALTVVSKNNPNLALAKRVEFNEWLDEYIDYVDMQTENLLEDN